LGLGFATPACIAQSRSFPENADWMSLCLFVLLLGVSALARRRIRRLATHARDGDQFLRQRVKDLEQENSELRHAQQEMRDNGEHDGLTGLWNHRMIVQRLRQEVDRSHRENVPLSVIMADIDNFRNVNDTFNQAAGDLVLMEISSIIQSLVRSYDWVGRYGGEEFLVILPGLNFVSGRRRAEQFRRAVETAHTLHGKTAIQVTASFGVASGFPSTCETMMEATDAALYRAKCNGRNCVIATEIEPAGSSPVPVQKK
jgi:diguanylate cyclase (GGDEF)-like protein